jgi:hypothetical protein
MPPKLKTSSTLTTTSAEDLAKAASAAASKGGKTSKIMANVDIGGARNLAIDTSRLKDKGNFKSLYELREITIDCRTPNMEGIWVALFRIRTFFHGVAAAGQKLNNEMIQRDEHLKKLLTTAQAAGGTADPDGRCFYLESVALMHEMNCLQDVVKDGKDAVGNRMGFRLFVIWPDKFPTFDGSNHTPEKLDVS